MIFYRYSAIRREIYAWRHEKGKTAIHAIKEVFRDALDMGRV